MLGREVDGAEKMPLSLAWEAEISIYEREIAQLPVDNLRQSNTKLSRCGQDLCRYLLDFQSLRRKPGEPDLEARIVHVQVN